MKSNTYTLAALKLRRAELMKQIEEKEQSIRSKTDALLATPVPGNKAELIVNRAMATMMTTLTRPTPAILLRVSLCQALFARRSRLSISRTASSLMGAPAVACLVSAMLRLTSALVADLGIDDGVHDVDHQVHEHLHLI